MRSLGLFAVVVVALIATGLPIQPAFAQATLSLTVTPTPVHQGQYVTFSGTETPPATSGSNTITISVYLDNTCNPAGGFVTSYTATEDTTNGYYQSTNPVDPSVYRVQGSNFAQSSNSETGTVSDCHEFIVEPPSAGSTRPPSPGTALIQQNNYGCGPSSASCPGSISVSFPSNVTSGDVVVVGVMTGRTYTTGPYCPTSSPCIRSVTDSLGSTFNQIAWSEDGPDVVGIYVATLSSGEVSDTVTVSFGPYVLDFRNVYIYEVSGVTTFGATGGNNADNSGTSVSLKSTQPIAFEHDAFLLGMIGDYGVGYHGYDVTAGIGFIVSPDNSGTKRSHAMFSINGAYSPSFFTATLAGSTYWAEAAVVLNALTTTSTTSGVRAGAQPQPAPQGFGAGLAFAVMGIGAGVAAAVTALAVAATRQTNPEVFTYAGQYYCKRHRVLVVRVQGGYWCPVEGRLLRA